MVQYFLTLDGQPDALKIPLWVGFEEKFDHKYLLYVFISNKFNIL